MPNNEVQDLSMANNNPNSPDDLFSIAFNKKDLGELKRLLESGYKPVLNNTEASLFDTLLLEASQSQDAEEFVSWLINEYENNISDLAFFKAFEITCKNNNYAALKVLIQSNKTQSGFLWLVLYHHVCEKNILIILLKKLNPRPETIIDAIRMYLVNSEIKVNINDIKIFLETYQETSSIKKDPKLFDKILSMACKDQKEDFQLLFINEYYERISNICFLEQIVSAWQNRDFQTVKILVKSKKVDSTNISNILEFMCNDEFAYKKNKDAVISEIANQVLLAAIELNDCKSYISLFLARYNDHISAECIEQALYNAGKNYNFKAMESLLQSKKIDLILIEKHLNFMLSQPTDPIKRQELTKILTLLLDKLKPYPQSIINALKAYLNLDKADQENIDLLLNSLQDNLSDKQKGLFLIEAITQNKPDQVRMLLQKNISPDLLDEALKLALKNYNTVDFNKDDCSAILVVLLLSEKNINESIVNEALTLFTKKEDWRTVAALMPQLKDDFKNTLFILTNKSCTKRLFEYKARKINLSEKDLAALQTVVIEHLIYELEHYRSEPKSGFFFLQRTAVIAKEKIAIGFLIAVLRNEMERDALVGHEQLLVSGHLGKIVTKYFGEAKNLGGLLTRLQFKVPLQEIDINSNNSIN